MKINRSLFAITLLAALATTPALADMDKKNKDGYMMHFQQRHEMNMAMMQMLSDTMKILQNLNHRPTDEEKARLGDMIKQLDDIMAEHKQMSGKAKEYYKDHHGGDWDDDMGKHHKKMMN